MPSPVALESKIICGDFRSPRRGIASFPDLSVDHGIMDAPYSEHVHANIVGAKGREDLAFGYLQPEVRRAAAEQIARVVRRWVLIWTDSESAHLWIADLVSFGMEYIRTGIWTKTNGTPQMTGDRPGPPGESFVIAHQTDSRNRKLKKRWNGGGKPAHYQGPRAATAELHRTTKPLWLMSAMLRDFTDPDDLVVDFFAGSGSTVVAADTTGRIGIGWETRRSTAAKARRRLASTALPSDHMPRRHETQQTRFLTREQIYGT